MLRRGSDPIAALSDRFEPSELVTCDIVRCEVLRGIIRPNAYGDLARFFDLLVHVTMTHHVWRETEELSWNMDRAGKILPLTDLIIAACALHAEAYIVTRDDHFKMVPRLRLIEW